MGKWIALELNDVFGKDINRLLEKDGVFVATWCFTNVCKCHIIKNFFMQDIFDKLIIKLGFKFIKKNGRGFKFIKIRNVKIGDIVIAYAFSIFYKFEINFTKVRRKIVTKEKLRNLLGIKNFN